MPLLHNERQIKSVVIAGAGGFALELYDYLHSETLCGGPEVAGFIDDAPGGKAPKGIDRPHLGAIADFRPVAGQVVVVAIGAVQARRAVLQRLWANGAHTPAYIHGASAIVSPAATLGDAVIVCPFSIVNRNASLATGSVVNVHCSVGHGSSVGEYSVLSPYAALNGDASIGANCFLGTRATIYPRVSIGDGCIVDSHTGVRANAPGRHMISSRGAYQANPIRLPG